VVVFPLDSRTVINADLELPLPAATQADMEVSQGQEAVGLPSGLMACPAGMVDLDLSTGGKLTGCARCPAGPR
jgi:hypothetical protein